MDTTGGVVTEVSIICKTPPSQTKTRKSVRIEEPSKDQTDNSESRRRELVFAGEIPNAVNVGILTPNSMESRDNPFLPGGELSKETDDLLKRATIIRDQFLLEEEAKRKFLEEEKIKQERQFEETLREKVINSVSSPASDGAVPMAGPEPIKEESIAPATVDTTATEPRLKENGSKPGEGASPESVKVEIPKDSDKGSPVGEKNVPDNEETHKEKKKRKCCTIM